MTDKPMPTPPSPPPPPLPPDAGGPIQDEVTRITNIIMEQIGNTDVESALTVICNLAGQLVCALSEGRPSDIKSRVESIAENIRCAAIAKLLHDDEIKRKTKTWH